MKNSNPNPNKLNEISDSHKKAENPTNYHKILKDYLQRIMNQIGVRRHTAQNRGLESSDVQGAGAQPLGPHSRVLAQRTAAPAGGRAGSPAAAPRSSSMPVPSNNHMVPGDSSRHQPHSQKRQDADGRDQDQASERVPEPGKVPAEPPAGRGTATSRHYTRDALPLFL